MSSLNFRLGVRNLARNRKRTVISACFISFSLATLMFADGFINGFEGTMVRSATQLFSGEAQINRIGFRENYDVDLYLSDSEHIEKMLNASSDVKSYALRVQASAMVSSAAGMQAAMLMGVDSVAETKMSKLKSAILKGSYFSDVVEKGKATELLLGDRLADLLELGVGDRVVVTVAPPHGGELVQELFRVTGIIHFGSRLLDETMVFVPIRIAQKMLSLDKQVHTIVFSFNKFSDAANNALPIYQTLNSNQVEAIGWPELNPQLTSILEMNHLSLLICGGILFVLAGLGLVNAMFMSIYERTYELGILKAVGTRPMDIMIMVLIEATILGAVSVFFGLILGWGLTYWLHTVGVDYQDMEFSGVALHELIRPVIRWQQFTIIPFWVFVLTIVACIYPAIFAAKIVPSEAIRKSL